MNPQNLELLQSQEALQKLTSRDLRGVFALRLADILDEVEGRLQKLQGVQEDLSQRVDEGDLSQEEADEQWRELLEETLEIDEEPVPRSALRTVEISVADLKALSWMITEPAAEETPNTTQNGNAN
jgi:two-component sensor histidine kinase